MIKCFPSRDALADAAAATIADGLSTAIAANGRATAVLTGGSTPGPVYDRLSASPLDWRKVTLTLSDERWVTPDHPDSNEALVRARLMTGLAAPASFVPLKYPTPDLDTGARAAEEAVRELFPTDITLLGMGEDGHIASLFPDDPIANFALSAQTERKVVSVAFSGLAPYHPRISLTLAALTDTALVILLITGEAKRALVQRVEHERGYDPPVAALLRQGRAPVQVLWAP